MVDVAEEGLEKSLEGEDEPNLDSCGGCRCGCCWSLLWSSSDSDTQQDVDSFDSEEDDDEALKACFPINYASQRPNAHGGLHSRPNNSNLRHFSNLVRLSPLEGFDLTTSLAMRKLHNRGEYEFIHGCISTGKDANVYYATRSDGQQDVYYPTRSGDQDLAIKVYKTSVMGFKHRGGYVQGDYRFRHEYSGHNPRKQVSKWVEKEWRNLKRIKEAGIRCPTAYDFGPIVLVMEFIGIGWQLIISMRMLYQKAKLVHADLSEYNVLYFEGHLYMIDVSQAVELNDPSANGFLCKDCLYVSDFFKKHGAAVMTTRELFDFIVDPCISDDMVDSYLNMVQYKVVARGSISAEDEIADSVFVQSFIASSLENLKNVEADAIQITSDKDTEEMDYKTITALEQALSRVQLAPLETNSDEENSSDLDSSSGIKAQNKKVARKYFKKKVKEVKIESRKHELQKRPKAVKKRKKKLSEPCRTR
ncbi:putative non-specific serine/threonine protein kinase [Rosa chinensis]|uniref:non-specific serine/threonine protein kinase n=1 Tax=Rosa chinensis TaxID=74649 RepID=A0A2P6QID5_ROSCH|nr:putative non-specific serine/threonine protein kinase [Rosa chinensis]